MYEKYIYIYLYIVFFTLRIKTSFKHLKYLYITVVLWKTVSQDKSC